MIFITLGSQKFQFNRLLKAVDEQVADGKITDVGPRSAHIAGLPYEIFSDKLTNPKLELIAPLADDDKVFAMISGSDGRRVSLTLAGAANLLGSVPEGDYAYHADKENARVAWQALGDVIGCSAEEAARQAMDKATEKIWEIVARLIAEYKLSPEMLCLAGGGGSGGVIVPYIGAKMKVQWKIVKNAPIISTIGVAMAMVREVVERTVANPTERDIKSIRREALEQVMKSGASEASVEITIEIDKKANILRAVATGATEFKMNDSVNKNLNADELKAIAIKSMKLPAENVTEVAASGKWHIFDGLYIKKLFGLIPIQSHLVRVLDRNSVVCLQREGLGAILTNKRKLNEDFQTLLEESVSYGTVGEQLPGLFAYYGEKQIDLSGLASREQIISVLETEFDLLSDEEKIILLAVK